MQNVFYANEYGVSRLKVISPNRVIILDGTIHLSFLWLVYVAVAK